MGTRVKEISRQHDVVGELCQKENPPHAHQRRERKGEGRGDMKFFIAPVYMTSYRTRSSIERKPPD
jgi:hypothetical protein